MDYGFGLDNIVEFLFVVSLLILLDLLGCLHLDKEAAATGHQGVIVPDNDNVTLTLDVVLLPGLAPEQEDGDAGCDAGQC